MCRPLVWFKNVLFVCMYVCMHVCIYSTVHMLVCTHRWMGIRTHINKHIQTTNKQTNTQLYTTQIDIQIIVYRKQQKLQRRKLLWFIGFYHNVGKTFSVLL